MRIHFKVPTEIKVIIHKWGNLGFDFTYHALQSILTHEDWSTRWDLSDATLDDLETVGKWREETLEANINASSDSLFELMANALKPE